MKLSKQVLVLVFSFLIFENPMMLFSQEFQPDNHTVGLWHLNEGSGSIANDASGKNNHGQIIGTIWSDDGKFNNALQFDGDGDGIHINPPFDGIQNVFTIELYFKSDNFNGIRTLFRHRASYRDVALHYVDQPTTPKTIYFSISGTDGVQRDLMLNAQLTLNTWYHIAAVYNGQEMKLYFNGQLDNTLSATMDVSWSENHISTDIGAVPERGAQYSFSGTLDEIRISDIDRFENDYEFQPDDHTIGLWHFNEGAGSIANDASGNNNHGQISGANWTLDGKYGSALYFDGDGDGVNINPPFSGIQNVFTIELYFKYENFNQTRTLFRHRASYRDVALHYVHQETTPKTIYLSISGTDGIQRDLLLQTPLTQNTWYHIAAVYNGQEMKLYLNGQLDNSLSANMNVSWNENHISTDIGAVPERGPQYSFSGTLDEIRISDIDRFSATGIGSNNLSLPFKYKLYQNYPNPFNPSTNISFEVPNDQKVKIDLYDILGRNILTIFDGYALKGLNTVNINGIELSSNIYFYKLVTDNLVLTIFSQSSGLFSDIIIYENTSCVHFFLA